MENGVFRNLAEVQMDNFILGFLKYPQVLGNYT